jgi:hypothetical protein
MNWEQLEVGKAGLPPLFVGSPNGLDLLKRFSLRDEERGQARLPDL